MRRLLLTLALVCAAPAARAGPAPPPAALAERLEWLEARLAGEREAAAAWWSAWVFTFGAALGVQATLGFALDDETPKVALRVSAAKTALGFASMVLQPLPQALGPARPSPAPVGEAALRERLAAAEGRLRRAARMEALGQGPWAHLAGLAVNLAGSLWLWLHHDQPRLAATSFLLGGLVGELRILTQPGGAVEALEALEAGRTPRAQARARGGEWALVPGPAALLVAGRF